MKIRTDFVTNSSSSSFIFKEFDKKKLLKCIDEMAPAEDVYGLSRADALQEVAKLEYDLGEFKALGRWELREVFEWYEKELLDDIFQMDTGNGHAVWQDIEKVWKELELPYKELSKERRTRWNAYLVWHLNECYVPERRDEDWWAADRVDIFSEKYLDDMLNCYVFECWNDWMYEYIAQDNESVKRELMTFDGMHFGEILSVAFDAESICYENYGNARYAFVQLVKKSGICKFACGHMG